MTPEQITQQVPRDARLFALVPWTKRPRSEHAHLDAVPLDEFLALYITGNYGIALDGQFLLVDKDRDDEVVQAFEARLPETWMQTTWKRGTHRIYRVPRGFEGKNGRWPGGEIKVNGYLVGPGSSVRDADGFEGTYTPISSVDPIEAPDWLLDMVRADVPRVEVKGVDFDIMRDGFRDNELTSLGGFMRHKGYSESFIAASLAGIVSSGVVEQPPGREITAHDSARIAKSVSRYTPEGVDAGRIAAADWICATDIKVIRPPIEWWQRGFFPKGDLVTLYGDSGVGKSSLASWVAAKVTAAGSAFLFIGVEEPFERFTGRALLCDPPAVRAKLFAYRQGSRIMLPRDIPALREQVKLAGVEFIYFDSIYAHFERIQGENMAERARRCLGPLAEMAQELGVTVVGVFHENKEGDYLGSTEMVNVARVTLHATRKQGQPLLVSVHTTNLWDPEYALTFTGVEQPLVDRETGEVQQERLEDGTLVPMMVRVPVKGENRRWNDIRAGELEDESEDENATW